MADLHGIFLATRPGDQPEFDLEKLCQGEVNPELSITLGGCLTMIFTACPVGAMLDIVPDRSPGYQSHTGE
jgi:hypothetical protein